MTSPRFRKSCMLIVAASTLAGVSLTFATPASAAPTHKSKVSWVQTPDFPPPRDPFPAIRVEAHLIVARASNNTHAAWVDGLRWGPRHDTMPHKRFHKFVIQVRLERNNRTVVRKYCDFTRQANKYLKVPELHQPELRCLPSGWTRGPSGGYTADATLFFDIAYDGKGQMRREFAGTGSIS